MARSPHDVLLALVHGVADGRWEDLPSLYAERTHVVHPFDPARGPALLTRDALREHFAPTGTGPQLERHAAGITVHQTADPEVVIAEFEYRGTVVATGEAFALPGIFVLRVRDGEIVSSRDYFDHVTAAAIRGRLDDVVAAVEARRASARAGGSVAAGVDVAGRGGGVDGQGGGAGVHEGVVDPAVAGAGVERG